VERRGDLAHVPVLGLFDRTGENPSMAIVAWDYKSAVLEPLAQTSDHAVAWNGPID
jgi:hypothetical protein